MVRSISLWQTPPDFPRLISAELHLWRFPLDVSRGRRQQLEGRLSAAERNRQDRLLSPKAAADFGVARGSLRHILGRYLRVNPESLSFEFEAEGKPVLAKGQGDIHFNLAHSGDLALLAVVKESVVGVDLERLDSTINFYQIAEQFFTPREKNELRQVSSERQLRHFYRLWVQKEASLKKTGTGFKDYSALDSHPATAPCLLFPAARTYLGAIAFNEEITSISRFQLIEK